MAVYDEYRVYGPYTRKDNRQVVILVNDKQEHKTVSYPKYLVEKFLDRYLDKDDTVDHIDGNFTNNELSNLRVIPRDIHARSHTKHLEPIVKVCAVCGKEFLTTNGSRIVCDNKSCHGKCAHICGYNKGHNFIGGANKLVSNRSLVGEIPSVEAANSGKLLVGNPEQEDNS